MNSIEYFVFADTDGGDLTESRIDNILKHENTKILRGIMIDYIEVTVEKKVKVDNSFSSNTVTLISN